MQHKKATRGEGTREQSAAWAFVQADWYRRYTAQFPEDWALESLDRYGVQFRQMGRDLANGYTVNDGLDEVGW